MIKEFCDLCKQEINKYSYKTECFLEIDLEHWNRKMLSKRMTLCKKCKNELEKVAQTLVNYIDKRK